MSFALTHPDHPEPRRFTVAEVERMVETGVLAEDERVELIDGELVRMSPKGIRHEVLKTALLARWYRLCPPEVQLTPETTFRLSATTFLEPDIVVFPRDSGLKGLDGSTVLLALEIGASSLGYDLGLKRRVYARFGVRELWVIDAMRLRLHVHRGPEDGAYREVSEFGAGDLVTPALAPPEFALRLADLDIED